MLKDKRRIGRSFGLLAALALFAGLLPGGAAQAAEGGTRSSSALASASCVVAVSSCSSPAVAAGSDGVVEFEAYIQNIVACTVNVRDMTLNPTKQIFSTGFAKYYRGRITGLTNTYRVELRFCLSPGSYARIW
ncbi:hypothetical protein Ait01nite_012830 [Actinoplanes italicus]|uniref:Uncharacterized protein n=2 Tax=Actinoplanes italicus TaxID=113567 RepID=A0A2T0KH06_9ACTN|nr:hypothetical protein CLV67_104244 [Actinoplanes italicus]GIE28238.1 hypothetical protein Ait01nite_012830 [Actinoplanes italicus]